MSFQCISIHSPYYKRMETWDDNGHGGDPEWRGKDGPLHVTRGPRDNPLFKAFVEAGKQAGYEAESVTDSSDQNVLDEKEKADEAYYKRLTREMWIALSLGIPLMIYSLVVGEMTVTTNLERMAWLAVGLLTFGVMYFASTVGIGCLC